MANKRISELSSRTPSATDLMLVGDPTTGYSYKCLVSQVGGVTSVFGRTGAVTAQEGDYSLTLLSDVTITAPAVDQVLIYNGTTWVNAENYSNKMQHLVKLGASIGKGKAVYVSGASGTNMIVNLSSNDSEATSSKVLGLTASAGALNDMVYVITEGLLAGIDTSGSTAGDPVWLGTNGNLIFGGANRPVPPLNAVYLGVVTRVSATVGEVFIRVQNGFELEELHDVKFTSLANNHALVYNNTSQLWENKALSTTNVTEGTNLYYTDARARGAISLTTTGSGAATYNTLTGVLNIPTPSSVNLYNSDGTLTGNRTVTMGSNNLTFTGGNIAFGTTVPSPVQSAPFFLFLGAGGVISGNAVGTTTELNLASNVYFDGTNSRYRQARAAAQIYMGNDGHLQFLTYPTGTVGGIATGTERMRIFNTGNIGINTTTDAGFRLDVNGTARISNEITVQGSGTNTIDRIAIARQGSDVSISSVSGWLRLNSQRIIANQNVVLSSFFGTGTHQLTFGAAIDNPTPNQAIVFTAGSASVEWARFAGATGNFLINTSADSGFRFDVNGTARIQAALTVANAGILTGTGQIRSEAYFNAKGGSTTPGTRFLLYSIGRPDGGFGNAQMGGMGGFFSGAAWPNGFGLSFFTAEGADISGGAFTTEKMTIMPNGNIGINTATDAGFRLDVNGTMRVQGQITGTNNLIWAGRSGNNSATSSGAAIYLTLPGFSSQIQDETVVNTTSYFSFDSRPDLATNTTIGGFGSFYARQKVQSLPSGTTITTQYGMIIEPLNLGSTIYGIRSMVASASNRWNLYIDGTAVNYLNGDLGIGTTAPATKLHVNGSIRTANPSGGTAVNWRLGSAITSTVQLDTSGYLEVEVNGTAYKVALAMLP